MLTAIYCRVSSKQQVEGTSLDYQEEAGIKRAKELGVPSENIKIYREEGFSGEDIDRPEMNNLRDDIADKKVDRVIVLHPDRLSRELTDKLIVCTEFENRGVDLVFVDTEYADTPEGQLFFNMQSAIAQYELAQIKKRTRRGIISSAKKGQVMPMATAPFGYDYADGKLTINKEEAKYVKKMYEWYALDLLSIREIMLKLKEHGVLSKKSKSDTWSPSSISKVLRNETYIGKYYFNRTKSTKVKGQKTEAGNPKIKKEDRNEDEWIEIPVPPIIDVVTFNMATERRTKNKDKTGHKKYNYLLKNLMVCGHCGSKYGAFTARYKSKTKDSDKQWEYQKYACNRAKRPWKYVDDHKCDAKDLNADFIENYIWDNFFLNGIFNEEAMQKAFEAKQDDGSSKVSEMVEIYNRQLNEKQAEKKRIINLYTKGFIEEDEMEKDILKVSKDIKKLESELNKYEEASINSLEREKRKDHLLTLTKRTKKILESSSTIPFEIKRNLVEMLIDEVIIYHDRESNKGDKVVEVSVISALGDINSIGGNCTQGLDGVNKKHIYMKYEFTIIYKQKRGKKYTEEVRNSSLQLV